MVKAATATKRKKPAKPAATKKKSPPKAKAKAKAKAAAKKARPKKSKLLGGVAKGIAWLGDKVRGVVRRKPKKRKAKAKPPKAAVASGAGSSETLVTLRNPLP